MKASASNAEHGAAEPGTLCVVICAYNAERWVRRCLRSVRRQQGAAFRAIFIDDCSTDGTYAAAQAEVEGDARFSVHQNDENVGSALWNRRAGLRRIAVDPEDVVVVVDGDDWLAHDRVLAHVAAIYADPEVWLTYGSHVRYRGTLRDRLGIRLKRGVSAPYAAPIVAQRLFRYTRFRASHLRTFRRFLFDAIPEADLLNADGSWIGPGNDIADMVPMLEMAGGAHIRYVPEILYVYNDATPLSDRKIHRDEQILAAARIGARPPRPALARHARGPS